MIPTLQPVALLVPFACHLDAYLSALLQMVMKMLLAYYCQAEAELLQMALTQLVGLLLPRMVMVWVLLP